MSGGELQRWLSVVFLQARRGNLTIILSNFKADKLPLIDQTGNRRSTRTHERV